MTVNNESDNAESEGVSTMEEKDSVNSVFDLLKENVHYKKDSVAADGYVQLDVGENVGVPTRLFYNVGDNDVKFTTGRDEVGVIFKFKHTIPKDNGDRADDASVDVVISGVEPFMLLDTESLFNIIGSFADIISDLAGSKEFSGRVAELIAYVGDTEY